MFKPQFFCKLRSQMGRVCVRAVAQMFAWDVHLYCVYCICPLFVNVKTNGKYQRGQMLSAVDEVVTICDYDSDVYIFGVHSVS